MRKVILLFSVMYCVWAYAGPTSRGNSRLLFGFERPEEIAKWTVRDLTELKLTQAWAASGQSAAAITYQKWEAGKEQWPAVVAQRSEGALLVTDFSQYDTLKFSLYNPGSAVAELALQLRDSAGQRFSHVDAVAPKSRQNVAIPMTDIARVLNTREITELHLYVTRPARACTVYVDDIQLSMELASRAAALVNQARSLQEQVQTAGRQPNLPADLQQSVAAIPQLVARAERLQGQLTAAVETPEQAARIRRQLIRLGDQLEAAKVLEPRLQAFAFARRTNADGFVLATETPMRKVFLEANRFASTFSPRYNLTAARNEHESVQVIVFPLRGALRDVKWEISPLKNSAGQTLPVSVRLVGYVDCKQPPYVVPHTGWYPDPLLDFVKQVEAVPASEVLPLWVTVDVPEEAKNGDYRGALTVTAAGARPQSVDLRMQVMDFTLPRHSSLRTALSFRALSPRLYPQALLPEMTRKYEDWMLTEYHLNAGDIYGGVPKWDAARLRDLISKGLNAINLGYVSAPRTKDYDATAYWQSLDRQMDQIEEYLKVVDEVKARDLCYIYCFDEYPADQLDVVFETAKRLRQRFPDIKIMSTAYDSNLGLDRPQDSNIDLWVPLTPKYDLNAARIAEARKAGLNVWWYTCISPQHPYANWLVEYPAIEARLLMGAMTARYQPAGYLYYAVNRWPVNDKPITFGPRTDWNPASFGACNGDGSILCAGPDGPLATVRLENIRDGMEDYEYYLLLRKLLAEKKQVSTLGDVSQSVVQDLTHFTYDPQIITAERARLAKEILRLSKK